MAKSKRINNLFLLIVMYSLISCNLQTEKNKFDQSASDNQIVDTSSVVAPNVSYSEQEYGITTSASDGAFFNNGGHVELRASVSIGNNTNERITKLDFVGFLKIKFENETAIFIPTSFWEKSDEEFAKGILTSDGRLEEGDPISVSNPWLPNEYKSYAFTVPEPRNGYLDESYFQRTPEHVYFVIRYKTISIDGEHEKLVYYDILDLWKQYQKELGLRQ